MMQSGADDEVMAVVYLMYDSLLLETGRLRTRKPCALPKVLLNCATVRLISFSPFGSVAGFQKSIVMGPRAGVARARSGTAAAAPATAAPCRNVRLSMRP